LSILFKYHFKNLFAIIFLGGIHVIRFKLKELMDNEKVGQRELSRLTGIRQATLSAYINDDFKQIGKDHLDILCKFFNTNIEFIIEYTKEED
jgi:putative transcriptional regulator